MVGLEPTNLAAHEFESCVFTSFTTSAYNKRIINDFNFLVKENDTGLETINYLLKIKLLVIIVSDLFLNLWEKLFL